MKYPIAIERGDQNHAYSVFFPDVPGCYSAGDTLDEAVTNALEALEGFFDVSTEDGDALPAAGTLEEHQNNPEYKDYIWAFVDIDMTPYSGKSQKINVTLPEFLIHRIDHKVTSDARYKSRSDFLAQAARDELHQMSV